ncbi:fungal specific transcription factor domain-containing protein [Metarhizium guizhouense ARSEF 977]|uniref:Fungal specific transcription factor domain-containing protein n=1 Tax=Metarhizium guizhouense (strain ARSEF 977) TaxID=1276136 RepID=A0A0B4HVI8_METGA|nr:fungal specific transcription factor domain-containing protein [Metarhizium guizhouense ARSEF 977]
MKPEAAPEDGAAAAESAPAGLQPYSCLSCRRRRKKCDRTDPCANCRRAGTECVFVPRRPSTRQYSGAGALERVRYLEGVVQQLRAKLESLSASHEGGDGASSRGHTASPAQPHAAHDADGVPGLHEEDEDEDEEEEEVTQLQTEFGQLAVGDGRSRYIVSNFWANLTEKVDGAASILEDLAEEEEARREQGDEQPTSILGLGPSLADAGPLHPAPDEFAVYWRLYKENCYPIIRVLHMPTVEPVVLRYQGRAGGDMPAGVEALLFAVYFAAVASLPDEECRAALGGDKCVLVGRYKAGMERALARARLLETDEVVVLQAFAVFLGSLRSYCNLRLMWSLTSIAARLAQNMGLHRDGTHFRLPAFVVEARRRLWWTICALDARAAEDSGYRTSMHASGWDTQMPRNLDDADLAPGLAQLPASRVGFNEMAFGMWYAIAYILTELCARGPGELVDQAWRAIDAVLKADRLTRSDGDSGDGDDEFSAHSRLGSLHDFEYRLLNRLLRRARAAHRPASAAMPYRVPGPDDLRSAAHRFDHELASRSAELSPAAAAMNHCGAETRGQPFDHLLYGSLQNDVDVAPAHQMPDYLSDKGSL